MRNSCSYVNQRSLSQNFWLSSRDSLRQAQGKLLILTQPMHRFTLLALSEQSEPKCCRAGIRTPINRSRFCCPTIRRLDKIEVIKLKVIKSKGIEDF